MPKETKVEKVTSGSKLAIVKKWGLIKPLVFVFLVLWIFIGLFISAFVIQGTRRGMFDYVLFGKTPQQAEAQNVETPTETTLPKIGKINIACAEQALKPESIQKLVSEYEYDVTKLEESERAAFEKCILEAPPASPNS